MPPNYTIRSEAAAGYPWVETEGHVTLDVILAAIDDLCVDGAYATPCRLWDFRGCTMALSNDELRQIVAYGSARDREPGRVAILADSDLVYGLSRMYEVFRSSGSSVYRAFREEAQALAWLSADPDRPTRAESGNP